jgi:hypothetical protein
VLAALVGLLSVQPVVNMMSARQVMNTSFDPLDLVNTYGAFGTIGRERMNVVFQGTDDDPGDPHATWKDYEYAALPVAVDRRPVQIAPYQPRLDWQMWFAAMGTPDEYPWTLHLVWKLLHGDRQTLALFGNDPFPTRPPRAVRATLYRYTFVDMERTWWKREAVARWLPAFTVDDQRLIDALTELGWR